MCEELVEDDVLSQSHFSKLQHRIYYVKDTHVYAFLFDAEKTPVSDQHYTQLQISPLSVICLRQLNCRYIVKYCFCVICVYLHITQNILNVFTNQIACT